MTQLSMFMDEEIGLVDLPGNPVTQGAPVAAAPEPVPLIQVVPAPQDPPELLLSMTSEGIIVRDQTRSCVSGLLPVLMPKLKTTPTLHWLQTKIPARLFRQVLGFFLWTFQKYRGESQVRLYYNTSTHEWAVVVAPQEISTGLSTRELATHEDRAAAFSEVAGPQWSCQGTIHHHCDIGAFQSGTDHANEKKQNGLHLTIGNLRSPVHSIHGRATFGGVAYNVELGEWLEGYENPDTLLASADDVEFPDEWTKRLVEAPPRAIQPWHYGGHGAYGAYGQYSDDDWTRPYWRGEHTTPHSQAVLPFETLEKLDNMPPGTKSCTTGIRITGIGAGREYHTISPLDSLREQKRKKRKGKGETLSPSCISPDLDKFLDESVDAIIDYFSTTVDLASSDPETGDPIPENVIQVFTATLRTRTIAALRNY